MQTISVRLFSGVAVLVLILAGCGNGTSPAAPAVPDSSVTDTTAVVIGPGPTTTITPAPTVPPMAVAGELTGVEPTVIADGFDRPADVRSPLGDDRIFVVDQPGYVYIVKDGESLDEPFLDLSEVVSFDENERGLLTIAFHPRFADNGRFYVFFTDAEYTAVLAEYRVSEGNPDLADHDSGRVILMLPQSHKHHQSGAISFGPDGYLWLSLGDGGGIGDPDDVAQDPTNLYATIVRLDIDAAEPYAIPPDNPYLDADTGEPPEMWAHGVRNPWRISIDHETGLLFIADVGQEGNEEVNVVPVDSGGGYNFGWSITEGTACYFREEEKKEAAAAGALTCDKTGITMPEFEYGRGNGTCAIVGGSVYRGAAIPELHGLYFYGDYCGGTLSSFRYTDGEVTEVTQWLDSLGNITTIGTDGNGELVLTNLQGQVLRIDPIRNP